MEVETKKMSELTVDIKDQVVKVFVDGFYDNLKLISKKRVKLENAFRHVFDEDLFYIALINNIPAGIVACSNNKHRALKVHPKDLIKYFGLFKGLLVYAILKHEFHKPLTYNSETTYLECVATASEYRNMGVATKLMNYVYDNLDYKHYILEVVDNNYNAQSLYSKLGYVIFESIKEKHPKQAGFNYRNFMIKEKHNI
jgi:ribosomal protein S18 acetylase RimI-like enzyme